MSVKSTVESIRQMATTLREIANRIECKADELENTKNYLVCGDVVNLVSGMIVNIKLDSLVINPVRDLTFQVESNKA
jgi:hypothetical protein